MAEYPSDITVTKDPHNPNTTILSRWPTEEEKGLSADVTPAEELVPEEERDSQEPADEPEKEKQAQTEE